MRLRNLSVLVIGFLLIAVGIAFSQQYNTSGGWYSSDTRRLASTTDHLGLGVVGDAPNNDRFQIRADGNLQWGGGSAVPDVELQRTAASILTLSAGDTLEAPSFTGIGTAVATLGDAASTSASIVTDGAGFTVDLTSNAAVLTATTTATAVFTGADAAGAADTTYDTTSTGAIIIGSGDVTNVSIDSDVGLTFVENGDAIFNSADSTYEFNIDEDSTVVISSGDTTDGNTPLTITSAGTGALLLDGGGASAITIGSADVTGVTITTDGVGGDVVIDGNVLAKVPVVSLASGALTVNTINLATAGAADYDIPDGACNAAADVGNWVTVIIEDDSVVISITSDDASNAFFVPGLDIAAGNELDSISTAAYEGAHVTLVCMAADEWYATSSTTEADGTTFWADGGTAD